MTSSGDLLLVGLPPEIRAADWTAMRKLLPQLRAGELHCVTASRELQAATLCFSLAFPCEPNCKLGNLVKMVQSGELANLKAATLKGEKGEKRGLLVG